MKNLLMYLQTLEIFFRIQIRLMDWKNLHVIYINGHVK